MRILIDVKLKSLIKALNYKDINQMVRVCFCF